MIPSPPLYDSNDLPPINKGTREKVVIRARISTYHDEIASHSTAGRFSIDIPSIWYNYIKSYNNMDKTVFKSLVV